MANVSRLVHKLLNPIVKKTDSCINPIHYRINSEKKIRSVECSSKLSRKVRTSNMENFHLHSYFNEN